jgi:hypothetical protein
VLCAVVLAGAVTVVVLNQKSLARERSENQALLRDQAEAAQLSAENGELEQLRVVNEAVQKLHVANHDLPRMRNEIHRWRDEAGEAAKLRAENQLLSAAAAGAARAAVPSLPAGFLTRDNLTDAGFATPEATIQTLFHALSHGDIVRAFQCRAGEENHPMSKEQQDEEQIELQEQFGAFPGYRIAETNVLSTDAIQLGIQCVPGGAITPVPLIRVGGEWKIPE